MKSKKEKSINKLTLRRSDLIKQFEKAPKSEINQWFFNKSIQIIDKADIIVFIDDDGSETILKDRFEGRPDSLAQQPKYKLELTRQQANIINAACELVARLGMGQLFALEDFLPMRGDMDWEEWHKTKHEIEKLLRPFFHEKIRDSINSYLSILSPDTKESAKVACDIHDVLRHAISWDYAVEKRLVKSLDSPRDWNTMSGVNYDEPRGISGKQLPKIDRIQE